ncbi:MAG: Ditrans,polycis-undecaprenyl-diphosphate synthase ((2E,6E)-farnesyl-diphosphate specific) [Alphaproteobacteria bacterium MarineAlpha11_Bin1]|nr:MAG: Ditrans,polycis-undecaprenyl-diphosphate synthase ((2E,6E)-farnesyl-diphosphate specific) [Alphaproteobacteria bacterium MarineAlpha11_Bin1]|tara:strand:- start:8494 stop:9228 length:735 start_codon:yes stop_codon:yes gene_type:complete
MKPLPSQPHSNGTPTHVAIIMDGNGRWAEARGLPRAAGHAQGAESVRSTVIAAKQLGIRYLTLYGFSLENWKRPAREISDLMGLLRVYLRKEIAELAREGVRIRFIGDRSLLEPDIVSLFEMSEQKTRGNAELELIVAFSYGSRQEITMAARKLAIDAAAGEIDPEAIDENALNSRLFTFDVPDPDLIIRTSGEQRISNFLLWQSAYSELVFTDVLWPDFSKEELESLIAEFGSRERRYGITTV